MYIKNAECKSIHSVLLEAVSTNFYHRLAIPIKRFVSHHPLSLLKVGRLVRQKKGRKRNETKMVKIEVQEPGSISFSSTEIIILYQDFVRFKRCLKMGDRYVRVTSGCSCRN